MNDQLNILSKKTEDEITKLKKEIDNIESVKLRYYPLIGFFFYFSMFLIFL